MAASHDLVVDKFAGEMFSCKTDQKVDYRVDYAASEYLFSVGRGGLTL